MKLLCKVDVNINVDVKIIIDYLDCDCEVFSELTSDEELVDKFNKYTVEEIKEGFVPVIIVASDVLSEALELAQEDADLELTDLELTKEDIEKLRKQTIQSVEQIDVKAFLKERLQESMQMHQADDIEGDFIGFEASHCFYSYNDYNDQPMKNIILVKIPVKNPWEIAAWIPMGGFNDCPNPAEQVAVFNYWYEKYGAVPAVVTYENWEMELKKPPVDKQQVLELAKEQFAFCYDRVMQNGGNRDSLKICK